MIFFMSHVEIDHSLGVKKRSYIDRLNEHSEECKEEIKKLCKSVNKVSKLGKVFVIGYSKKGEE